MKKTAINSWRLEKYLLCGWIVSHICLKQLFVAVSFIYLSRYWDHQFCSCSCFWDQLLLFTACDSWRHENDRSQHVGTGRMWWSETAWQWDRNQKKSYELPRPAMQWIIWVCWFLHKCIRLGMMKNNQKMSLNCFPSISASDWLIIQRWTVPTDHTYVENSLQEKDKKDTWVTKTFQSLLLHFCPLKEKWRLGGVGGGVGRDKRGMPEGWEV